MARTGFFHHIGTFLLFAATVLLIITDISAPVVNNIALLRVDLANRTSEHKTALTFGTFGHCIINTPGVNRNGKSDDVDYCSDAKVGYNPVSVLEGTVTSASFSDAAETTTKALTRVMILHPIATGISFIAFLLALGSGVVGSFLASLVALVAFVVTLVVLITDFVGFAILRNKVNDLSDSSSSSSSSTSGLHAKYGSAMWTTLVAAIFLLLGTIVVFFTCCSARLHSRSAQPTRKVEGYVESARRRRWFA